MPVRASRDGHFGRLALSIEKMYKGIQRKHDRKECACYDHEPEQEAEPVVPLKGKPLFDNPQEAPLANAVDVILGVGDELV